jgi:hypothetical protein
MTTAGQIVSAFALVGIVAMSSAPGCSSKPPGNTVGGGDDGGGGSGSGNGGGFDGGVDFSLAPDGSKLQPVIQCEAGTGLVCRVSDCGGGINTSISGRVYDPAGQNPLYGITVYVPGSPVQPLPTDVTCRTCTDLFSGTPAVAATLTDEAGHFSLLHVPDGDVPLVIQTGKWRMQTMLKGVQKCQDNPQPDKSLRLPKNHTEGDIPNIAISTGGADSLECLLSRIGVDKNEYAPGATGPGHIHIFRGTNGAVTNPGPPMSSVGLWDTKNDLMLYDVILLSCEGQATANVTPAAQQALFDYVGGGGRVFASHYHWAWFTGPTPTGPFSATIPPLATWQNLNATGTIDDAAIVKGNVVETLPNGMPFPEGTSLKKWLGNVGALEGGQLPIAFARHNSDLSTANTLSQPWINLDPGTPNLTPAPPMGANATTYFTVDLPFNGGPEGKTVCGRVVYSDLHVSGGPGKSEPIPSPPAADYVGLGGSGGSGGITPDGCATRTLTPQEKALEFMLFNLSSCLTPPGMSIQVPVK